MVKSQVWSISGVFGSTAYALKDSRKKLDSKTRKCILIGYGSVRKGYRLYDRAAHQVLHSRNVGFDEQESTVPTPESETGEEPAPTQRVLELDMSEEANQEDEEERISTQPQVRRSRPVDYYGRERVNLTIHHEPTSFEEATSSPERDQWNQAIDSEMESLKAHKVWELTTLPPRVSMD